MSSLEQEPAHQGTGPMPALQRVRAEAARAGMTVLRAMPRGDERLLLTVREDDGSDVVGQWFADRDACAEAAQRTAADSRAGAVSRLGDHLLVQRQGADRRLPLLHRLVGEGHHLVAHRPERRGVVRAPDGVSHTKVVPPSRTARLARGLEAAGAWRDVTVPRVLSVDPTLGAVVLATLPGRTLHEHLADGSPQQLAEVGQRVGRVVARLHAVSTDPTARDLPDHGLDAEVELADSWCGTARRLAGHDPDRHGHLRRLRERVRQHRPGRPVLLHRDLHDKQLLVDDHDVGILDLDLCARGEAALDLANLLVHLELRVHQTRLPAGLLRPLVEAVLEGYEPDEETLIGLPLFAGLTRLRLAGLYALRPGDDPAGQVARIAADPLLDDLC